MVSFLSFVTLALAGTVVASAGRDVGRYKSRMEGNLERRVPGGCSDSQVSFFNDAFGEGFALAFGAFSYLQGLNGISTTFTTYFGNVQDTSTQKNVFFDVISGSTLEFSCTDSSSTCTNNNDIGNYGAYEDGGIVRLCPSFFDQFDTGHLCSGTTVDSDHIRGATVLQELVWSHNHTTAVYGCSEARARASSDPSTAATTGDNYRCFAMQVYIDTNCH